MTALHNTTRLQGTGFARIVLAAISTAALMGSWLFAPVAFGAEESCSSCDRKVSFSGDFAHRRVSGRIALAGAPAGLEDYFREGIYGANFTATLSGLPEGRYIITVGVVEEAGYGTPNAGERVFDIAAGDQSLAKAVTVNAGEGGTNKIQLVTGTVQHQADMIAGPLEISFRATTGVAGLNTLEVKDAATGTSLIYLHASDLVENADAAANAIPQLTGPVLWLDPMQPRAVRVKDLISRMSLAEKVRQMGNTAPAIHRTGLDLPGYDYWSEALHGVAGGTRGVTVFPQAIANGATFDPALVKQMGGIIGIEGRAKNNYNREQRNGNSPRFGGLNFWSPNINLFRDPRWGRGQETYGEDDFLLGRMGVAFILGLQGDDPKYTLALACAKHYAVHSGPESLRHVINIDPSERDFYEDYLPHFEAAVREGHVGAIMSAYNAVYGVPAPASKLLLTDILRTRWGFDGQVVSDCDAVGDIWRNHHYAPTAAQAAADALKAGNDLCCGQTFNSLIYSVRSNLVTMADIDVSLGRILESRFKLGLFDPTNMNPFLLIGTNQLDTAANRQVALQLARESVVLLKNSGVLPLDRTKVKRIAVFGANATDQAMLYGNYNGIPTHATPILDGIRAQAGPGVEVTYAQGCPLVVRTGGGGGGGGRGLGAAAAPARPLPELRAEALSNAANADILIYVGGINSQLEGEEGNARGAGGLDGFNNGDRTRIELPAVQEEFVQALAATGKPLIMVNCSGSAMALPWEAANLPAIVQAWYPGEEGGRAVGEILFGDVNPSGRLPVTFYKSTTDLPVFTNYSMANRTYRYFEGKPLWAFGYGLSYTKFNYGGGELESSKVAANGMAKVIFTVQNSGKVDGDEVAQVYFRHVNSAVPQPKEALCGFVRVHLNAGQTARIAIDIPAERLRYWDTGKQQYVVEPGKYEFLVGAASDDIRLKVPMTITAH